MFDFLLNKTVQNPKHLFLQPNHSNTSSQFNFVLYYFIKHSMFLKHGMFNHNLQLNLNQNKYFYFHHEI